MKASGTIKWSQMVLVACVWLPSTSAVADIERDLRAARQSLRSDVRHPHPEERVPAIRKLESYPTVEAARVLVLQGLISSEPELRRAVLETLVHVGSVPEVEDFLRETIVKDLKKRDVGPRTSGSLHVLLALEEASPNEQVGDLLRPAPQGNLPARELLVRVADELAETPSDTSVRVIRQLTGLPLFEKDFAVRRATIQALCRQRNRTAIDLNIELLEQATGEVRADLLKYLLKISGKSFTERKEWMAWWETNRETFDGQASQVPAPASPQNPPGSIEAPSASLFRQANTFYEIPLLANRIVFVIDTSKSMQGARIVRAKEQLLKAIEALAPEVEFNIVSFSGTVRTWQKKLVFANSKNKHEARRFVELQPLGSFTASYEGLSTGLRYDAEAIYFLTDGMPNSGRIKAPADIVQAITTENRFRRVSFHTVGVGVGPIGGLFDTFLRTLASENYGEYRRVDE